MTPKERYFATLLFGQPDKVPFAPGGPRESTLKRWHAEGLPVDREWFAELVREAGIVGFEDTPHGGIDVTTRMMPMFDEKVLSHENGHYIVQDWMGAITEISDEFDYTYIRSARDFVTRKWHRFPVQEEADWAAMKLRYNLDTPGRFGEDFAERCRRERDGGAVIGLTFNGPFWQMREWCGFEGLCLMMIEQPGFVEEMARFWNDWMFAILGRLVEAGAAPDRILVNEDMAYKAHPMISPAMTRRFIQPSYVRWISELRRAGTRIFEVDSDGCVDLLIPIWIESGFNVASPMEVAAHTDLPALRAEHGHQMAFNGGVDKRCIAAGGQSIVKELARLAPVIHGGGFLPGCDHGVPHDISWRNYIEYGKLLAELTGWL